MRLFIIFTLSFSFVIICALIYNLFKIIKNNIETNNSNKDEKKINIKVINKQPTINDLDDILSAIYNMNKMDKLLNAIEDMFNSDNE